MSMIMKMILMNVKTVNNNFMKSIIVLILIVLVASFGYCMNIYKIFGTDFASPYKAEVIRATGILVPPVGMIAGFLTIED